VENINDEDTLLRRYPIGVPNYIRADGSISSFAFARSSKDTDGLSVDLERLSSISKSVLDRNKFGLLRINAGQVRSISLDCKHNPVNDNPAHSLITGKITDSLRSKLIGFAKKVDEI
jgi:hypothetical protein